MIPLSEVGQAHWLLVVDIGGRTFRVADEALEVDGDVYRPGLDALEVSVTGDVAPTLSVSISQAAAVDWPELASVAGDLGGGAGTLYRWHEGGTPRAVLSGVVIEPEHGDATEALDFTLSRPTWLQSATVPEPSHAVSPETWTQGADEEESASDSDAAYPLIIGTPSRAAASGRLVGGSRAVSASVGTSSTTVRDSAVIVADGVVVADEATVLWASDDGDVSEVLPLTQRTDALGQTVTVIDWSSALDVTPVPSGGYRVHWSAGGGIPSTVSPGQAMTSLSEVIEYLLRRGNVPVDAGRQRASTLWRYRVDVAITAPVQPESWIRDHFAAPLGLYRLDTDEGQSWHEWPVTATETTAGVVLIVDGFGAGVPVMRTSGVRASSVSDIANRITVAYAMTDGKPTRRVTVAGDTSGGAVQSLACAWSRRRYGDRPRQLDLAWCYDDATAERVATRYARMVALPTSTLTVEGGLALEALVVVGDVVAVTAAGLHWTERLCMVREVRLNLYTVALVLQTIPDPANIRDRGTA